LCPLPDVLSYSTVNYGLPLGSRCGRAKGHPYVRNVHAYPLLRSHPNPTGPGVQYCTSLQSLRRARYASTVGQRACERSQGLSVRPRPSCAVFALRCKRARASRFHLDLCHGLCHNLAIPAGVGPSLAVSLTYTRKAVNVRETRMNTALPCRSVSLGSLPYQ
jgi:hypothetical protein